MMNSRFAIKNVMAGASHKKTEVKSVVIVPTVKYNNYIEVVKRVNSSNLSFRQYEEILLKKIEKISEIVSSNDEIGISNDNSKQILEILGDE